MSHPSNNYLPLKVNAIIIITSIIAYFVIPTLLGYKLQAIWNSDQ